MLALGQELSHLRAGLADSQAPISCRMLQDGELHTLTIVDTVLENMLINDSAIRDWLKDTVGRS